MSEHLRAQWRKVANSTEDYLDAVDKMMPTAQVSIERIIRRNGKRWNRVSTDLPPGLQRGAMGECFRNATNAAFDNPDLIYCEGYADSGYFPTMHAWVVDGEGTVYDPTWSSGSSYYGIAFHTSWLRQFIAQTGMYGVLAFDIIPKPAQIEILKNGFPAAAINATGSKTASRDEVPKAPGEASIPSGAVRLYHVTGEQNLNSIQSQGLTIGNAQGSTYGEPNLVWASTKTDYWKDPVGKIMVEFWVPWSKIVANFGVPGSPNSNQNPDSWSAGNHNIAMPFDIPANQIVTIHENWHNAYRYLNDSHSRGEVKSGFYDNIEESQYPDEYRAIQKIKREGRKVAEFQTVYHPGETIYRGLRCDLPPDVEERVRFLLAMETDEESYRKYGPIGGKKMLAGEIIVRALEKSHRDSELGLGRHWSTKRRMAENAAQQGGRGRFPVILTGTYTMDSVDETHHGEHWTSMQSEAEVTLKPGGRVTITNVEVSVGFGLESVLHTPIEARA